MPSILDVAIGTLFVFLLFSLVVSAFNEFILSNLDQRAKALQLGLNELLSISESPTAASEAEARSKPTLCQKIRGIISSIFRWLKSPFVMEAHPNSTVTKLCEHGLVNAFSRTDGGSHPSYIPSGAFVTALLDLIATGQLKGNTSNAVDRADLSQNLTAKLSDLLPESKLKQSLISLATATGNDLEKFKIALEAWFNSSMERVSGWYKRLAQKWMILIGFALAAVLNVDTIHIVQSLSNNPNLAKAIASQGEYFIKKPPTAQQDLSNGKDPAKALKAYQDQLDKLSNTGLPIGWDKGQLHCLGLDDESLGSLRQKFSEPHHFAGWFSAHFCQLVMILAGWFITAIAGSLGAPFWFDLLNRFVNIRNAGKAPGEVDPTQPKPVTPQPSAPTLDRLPTN